VTRVTVAVVTAQTREPLRRCLASLQPDVDAGLADVHVVDNASTDGTAEMVGAEFPWAHLHVSTSNLGYGPAVNLAARHGAADWIVAANSDVRVRPGALATLVRTGDAIPRAGAVSPRLVLPDGGTQHSAYPLPTVPLALAFNLGLATRVGGLADRLCLDGHWDATRRRSVPWAIAAFLAVRRRAFDQIGGFDPRQWMYAEDLDLGWRLHDAGWLTVHDPAAVVDHDGSVATRAAFGDGRRRRWQDATYACMRRRRGPVRTAAVATLNAAGAAAHVVRGEGRWREENRDWLRLHLRGLRLAARS
jgi:N-acetylglucosaminyl-diphospho-decaprenol L-rhamnosyltransferase